MWVKICANTNLEDALLAAELGADAVGFVFAPSKRQVTPAQVAEITPHLPPGLERVGVFAVKSADEIARAVEHAGLTAVQLHGGIDLELTTLLAERLGPEIGIIQTLHWVIEDERSAARVKVELAQLAAARANQRILIDSKVGGASGGTGVTFDWSLAQDVLRSQPELRIIVAGGLTPENVGEAIRQLKPWGVDVASGVEQEPGRKSPDRLKRFIDAAQTTK